MKNIKLYGAMDYCNACNMEVPGEKESESGIIYYYIYNTYYIIIYYFFIQRNNRQELPQAEKGIGNTRLKRTSNIRNQIQPTKIHGNGQSQR